MNDFSSDTIGVFRRELRDMRTLAYNLDSKVRQVLDGAQAQVRPADCLVRAATASFIAKVTKRSIDGVVAQAWPVDMLTPKILLRAAVAPAMTSVPAWAGDLAGTVVADFFASLPASAYSRLTARAALRLDFSGAARIRVPAPLTPAGLTGGFVGEGQAIRVAKRPLTGVTLEPKKFAIITHCTFELGKASPLVVEQVLRLLMTEAASVQTDALLLSASAPTPDAPPGLLSTLTALPASTATPLADAMAEDLGALIGAIPGAVDPVFIVSARQAVAAEVLAGSPQLVERFITSPVMPVGRVVCVDAAQFVSMSGDTPAFDVSEEVALHEESVDVLPIVGGPPPVPAAPVASIWQTGSLAIRMITSLSWGMRLGGRVSYLDGASW